MKTTTISIFICAILAFLILHITTPALPFSAEIRAQWIVPFKTLLFLGTIIFLLFYPSCLVIKEVMLKCGDKKQFQTSAWVFVGLCLLAVPLKLMSMGAYYGEMSFNPFDVPLNVYHKRLLSPALAHFLGFRGQILYWVFSLIINFLITLGVQLWLIQQQIFLKTWQLLSICTSSFVIHHFGSVGYPEALMYVWFLMIMLLPPTANLEKLALMTACLLTHESSVFMLIPFGYFYLDKKYWIHLVALIGLYVGIWLSVHQFDIQSLTAINNVQGKSGVEWLKSRPNIAIWGILFSYKALWLVIIVAIVQLFQQKKWQLFTFIVGTFLTALFVTLIAIDTSRLMGLAFPAFLVAFAFLYHNASAKFQKYLPTLLIINLILPSADVVLHCGIQFVKGFYLYGKWLVY